MDSDGTTLFVGAMDSNTIAYSKIGGVHVYTRGSVGAVWQDSGTVIRPQNPASAGCASGSPCADFQDAQFGSAISIQGDLMAVGAYNYQGMGAVFIYHRSVPSAAPYLRIIMATRGERAAILFCLVRGGRCFLSQCPTFSCLFPELSRADPNLRHGR